MLSCQLALYPLETVEPDKIIIEAVKQIDHFIEKGLTIDIGDMSTIIKGPDAVVWEAVQELFNHAKANEGKIVLNIQISNVCGCDLEDSINE